MSTVKLNSDNFEEEVLKAEKTVLVDFWAPWCGPCQVAGPILEEISEEEKENVRVGKLNVDENQQLASQYQVRGIPTVIVFKDGEPKKRLVGVQEKQTYKKAIE